MKPKEDATTCWKPNAVQLKIVKASNAASFVSAKKLFESPALECVTWTSLTWKNWFGVVCCCLCSLGLEAPSLHIRVNHRTSEAVVVLGAGLAS